MRLPEDTIRIGTGLRWVNLIPVGVPVNANGNSATARVVCVSADALLRNTRQLVLSLRYVAVSVPRAADLRLLASEGFDAVVLCHTLSPQEVELATDIALRQWPEAEIIVLSFSGVGATPTANHLVRTGQGPEYLLNTVDHLLKSHRAPMPRAAH